MQKVLQIQEVFIHLYPRASYYALKIAHQLNPYEDGVTPDFVETHFDNIELMDAVLRARGDKAALGGNEKIKLSNLRAEFTTFNTGGTLITTPTMQTLIRMDIQTN